MKRVLLASLLVTGCTAQAGDHAGQYTLTPATTPATIAQGNQGQFKLSITPVAPWVMKTTTPMKISLSASDGISLSHNKLTNKDILKEGDGHNAIKTVATSFQSKSGGEQTIGAKLSFFLCTDEICKRFSDKLTYSFKVK